MTPVKFLNYIIQAKNRIMEWMIATATVLAALLTGIFLLFDIKTSIEIGIIACVYILYLIAWTVINHVVDDKIGRMLKDKIDEEAQELADALMRKRIYQRSQIIPILKKLIEKYGEDNLTE